MVFAAMLVISAGVIFDGDAVERAFDVFFYPHDTSVTVADWV